MCEHNRRYNFSNVALLFGFIALLVFGYWHCAYMESAEHCRDSCSGAMNQCGARESDEIKNRCIDAYEVCVAQCSEAE